MLCWCNFSGRRRHSKNRWPTFMIFSSVANAGDLVISPFFARAEGGAAATQMNDVVRESEAQMQQQKDQDTSAE